jgi:uncharacterized phage protein (TIGR01671 family)
MDSELKFRTWIKDCMFDVLSINFNTKTIIISENCENVSIPFCDAKLMQFTGLHDKNGKEIFDGDIVKTNRSIFRVFWENAQFKVDDLLNKRLEHWPETLYSIGSKYEVIGNIYEK